MLLNLREKSFVKNSEVLKLFEIISTRFNASVPLMFSGSTNNGSFNPINIKNTKNPN